MLRGQDSQKIPFKKLRFPKFPGLHNFKYFMKTLCKDNYCGPTQNSNIFNNKSIPFQNKKRFSIICLCLKSLGASKFYFCKFTKMTNEYKKNKSSKIVTLCFVIDIGTILATIHSCFLIDIGIISKIFKILLNDSSSFFGARLFPN